MCGLGALAMSSSYPWTFVSTCGDGVQRSKWTGCHWSGRRCLQEHLWHPDCLAGTAALAAIGMALGAGSSVCRALVCRDHYTNLFIIYPYVKIY